MGITLEPPARSHTQRNSFPVWWELDIMSIIGFRPPHLSEAELKAPVLEALARAPGPTNLETYHARFDHLERGISIDDVIHGLERAWKYERQPEFNENEWQWNIASQPKP
jgi:hypothetical protein